MAKLFQKRDVLRKALFFSFLGHVEKKFANENIPTIIYMRKEITGNDLETTTLKSLGLTGGMSAALRFSYKQLESVNQQANVYVPAPKLEPSVKEEVAHR